MRRSRAAAGCVRTRPGVCTTLFDLRLNCVCQQRFVLLWRSITHHFLIAMPNMVDPFLPSLTTFANTTIGRAGRNRPSDRSEPASAVQAHRSQPSHTNCTTCIFRRTGADRPGFVLHQPVGWQCTLKVQRLGLTTSKTYSKRSGGNGPSRCWSPWATPAGRRDN
jgi:hypothetical protein